MSFKLQDAHALSADENFTEDFSDRSECASAFRHRDYTDAVTFQNGQRLIAEEVYRILLNSHGEEVTFDTLRMYSRFHRSIRARSQVTEAACAAPVQCAVLASRYRIHGASCRNQVPVGSIKLENAGAGREIHEPTRILNHVECGMVDLLIRGNKV